MMSRTQVRPKRPARRTCHVSDREQVLLNFIRCQLNRTGEAGEVDVNLRIRRGTITWRIVAIRAGAEQQ